MRQVICLLFAIFLSSGSPDLLAQERGVKVRVRGSARQPAQERVLYRNSYALLLGNSDYRNNAVWDDLPGAREDIGEVEKALQAQGFVVEKAFDLTKTQFNERLAQFIGDYGQDYENRLLIYYAGHGYTARLADGRVMGYLVMTDAPEMPAVEQALAKTPPQLGQFLRAAVPMNEIRTASVNIAAKHALFVFDSCFSGAALYRDGPVNVPDYINNEVTEKVRAFLTAGGEKEKVLDNSPFRRAFVRGLAGKADTDADGYVLSTELANYIKKEVNRDTKGRQSPRFGKIDDPPELQIGDMVFVMAQGGGDTAGGEAARSDENALCQRLAASRNEDELQAYLDAFGNNGQCAATIKYNLALARRAAKAGVTLTPGSRVTPTPTPAPVSTVLAAGTRREFVLKAGLTANFRWIPASKFTMGEGSKAREVTISQGFWMGETEVTQGQWKAVMGNLLSKCDYGNLKEAGISDNLPVVCVSWDDAQRFIRKLSSLNDGYKYALPSEAQWEYAARAGTTTRFYWGEDETQICHYGNITDQAAKQKYNWDVALECNDGYASLAPVGTFQPNAWGLSDMAGNVWEWTTDIVIMYSSSSTRVLRGSSWSGLTYTTSLHDTSFPPGIRGGDLGFRLIRVPL